METNINIGTFLNYPIKEFIKINYSLKGKENLNNKIIKVTNEVLLETFKNKYGLDIKDNNIDKLNLINKNIENDGLNELSKIEFKMLKELYLNNNRISDINIIGKMNLINLIILNLENNKISDINIFEKVKSEKLEILNFRCNKIANINILAKVNFKELKYLNFFNNLISDIKVFEKVKFEKLEYLNLGGNNISDINILEKVNFKKLKILYLHINNISNITIFEKVNFKNLKELNLCENNINERENDLIIQNLKSKIKNFFINFNDNSYSPPMTIGIIFDVTNDILSQLIKFDKEKSFFENLCHDYKGEIISLINGNKEMNYYDINSLLLSAINYISNEIIIFLKNQNKNSTNQGDKNLFDESCLVEIFETLRKNQDSIDLINSNIMYDNILILKDIISKNYSEFVPNLFELFNPLILKPSLVNIPLKKIFEVFEKNYSQNKYIIIISDGNSKETEEDLNKIINEAQKNEITIVTLYLIKYNTILKKIYSEFPAHFENKLKYLFNISSKVNYKNPFARYFIKKGWEFPKEGEGVLFLETNLEELNKSNFLCKELNEIKYEGIDIKIEDMHYNNLIKYKYQFLTKNQSFGTCWANAYAASIFLTNKRIFKKNRNFRNL